MTPRKGRILAVKWGYNPNSSSLGVDVTFFLLGASALAILTPAVSGLLYLRRLRGAAPAIDDAPPPATTPEAP
ncbi:MAG: hypothetical protein IPL79_18870 [Myxococcales bacterium]|nr:hypothetical protein [Myxococcales bacterium]